MSFFANLFFLGTIISAVFTITAINPVNAVVGMTSVFVNGAIYLILKTFNFIGLSYLIIYVGAIAILFLFVVMMMNIKYIELSEVAQEYTKNLPLGATIGTLFLLELFSSVIVPLDDSFTSLSQLSANPQNGFLLPEGFEHICVPVSVSDPSFGGALGSYYSFSHIESLGNTLYTYGLLWFLLGSTILLLAMIGPICLCLIKRGA